MGIVIKSAREIEIMRQAGRIAAETLAVLASSVRPGMTTRDLDVLAFRTLTKKGATPSFKGYRGFPASLCASINDEVVHGIPDKRVLKEGDIISLDVGAFYKGFHGDSALTVPVGKVNGRVQALLEAGQAGLAAGIAAARAGAHVGDISSAVQRTVEALGFSVVREYTGHGVGRDLHEDPLVPNVGQPGQGVALKPGMTLALEPMINLGGWAVQVRPNGWTVVTRDGSWSAHFEHTVAITDGEADILTKLE
jgi:methionyl aminopeptidase